MHTRSRKFVTNSCRYENKVCCSTFSNIIKNANNFNFSHLYQYILRIRVCLIIHSQYEYMAAYPTSFPSFEIHNYWCNLFCCFYLFFGEIYLLSNDLCIFNVVVIIVNSTCVRCMCVLVKLCLFAHIHATYVHK